MNDSPLCPLFGWDFELGAPEGECPRPEQYWPLSASPWKQETPAQGEQQREKGVIAGHAVAQGPVAYARNQKGLHLRKLWNLNQVWSCYKTA